MRWASIVLTALVVLVMGGIGIARVGAAGSDGCGGLSTGSCGVNADGGHFHGLLAVSGEPWVLTAAAHSGTSAGCGDCTWSLVLACPASTPTNPVRCTTDGLACPTGELSYRLFLSTDNETDALEGSVCIGGPNQPIPISDDAAGEVAKYLRNVVPPDLVITTKPTRATLAGLPTYFRVRPPASLRPAPFGNGGITETITIAPNHANWDWGDGTSTGWVTSTTTQTHSYIHGGNEHGSVTTRWGATYTISYAGETFGPYNAVGQLSKRQPFGLPVRTASPVLTSH